MTFTAIEIAKRIQGTVIGDGDTPLSGIAPADQARKGDLTFAENEAYLKHALESDAAAVLVEGDLAADNKVLIRVPNARLAVAALLNVFHPPPVFAPAIHESAVVHESARVDPSAHIGPGCHVEANAQVGPGCVLQGNNSVGAGSVLKGKVHLFPNVTLYANTQIGERVRIHAGTVVGSDGFGYVFDGRGHMKIPQVGNVVIADDVEIGANVTIDCGALGSTVIGRGTKIDNLVQVAHNVVVGEHCLLVAQVGVSGSTRLGNFVTLAGQVGLAGHLKIGSKVTVGAQSGVMNNIPDGEKWLGSPARDFSTSKRQLIGIQRLPELLKRVKALEERLKSLETTQDSGSE